MGTHHPMLQNLAGNALIHFSKEGCKVKLIILAGMPATGKSTVARQLQKHFGFPILEKDAIKECLFDTIGFESYAQKRQLDVAANTILLKMLCAMLSADQSVIVDNNFDEESAELLRQMLQQVSVPCVTVFLKGDPAVLYERYVARDSANQRHLGHAMQTHYPPHEGEETAFFMSREGFDQRFVHRKMDCMAWGGLQITLDATHPETIQIGELVKAVEDGLSEAVPHQN